MTGIHLIRNIDSCKSKPGTCTIWWLGQQGYAVKAKDTVCYVDAFLSPHKGRRQAPPLKPSEVTNAALVLGTHDHADHIDRMAWPGIAQASPKAVFIVPKLLRNKVIREVGLAPGRVMGVDCGITIEHAGFKVTGVPASHEFLDVEKRTGLHPYLGYIVQANGVTLYHAGDTCLYEGMQDILRAWKLDAAFFPINGRDAERLARNCIGNMTYQEAADLAGAIQPRITLPGHWDMFATNGEDPRLFIDYMRVKYPHLKARIPEFAKRMTT